MKLKEEEGKVYVFDIIRRKYVYFTPEENVRQHIIHWMIDELNYPKTSISVEKSIKVFERIKRYDIVVYKESQPWLLVECKSAQTKIKQEVFDQIGTYNIQLKVPYLLVTNGISNYIVQVDFAEKKFGYLQEMPSY